MFLASSPATYCEAQLQQPYNNNNTDNVTVYREWQKDKYNKTEECKKENNIISIKRDSKKVILQL